MPDEVSTPMDVEVLPSAALEQAESQRASLLRAFENRRAARAIAVPTSEDEVRAGLRSFGEPAFYYGEDLHDRRERLRAAMARAERRLLMATPFTSKAEMAMSPRSQRQQARLFGT